MNPVEDYLKEINMIKSTGGAVDEESFYTPLCNLMNEVGKKLKPKVFCHSEVKDTGAGNPDFGLYSKHQLQNLKHGKPLIQIPERGVIEVKPTSDDAWVTAEGEQVTKYWGHYGQILVTNYRDFVFVGQDENGNPIKLESFSLADNEASFWDLTTQPRKTAKEKGERLIEYIRRVMLHSAIISDPEKVAWFLASYAKEAKARIELAGELPGLAAVRRGLEESLGMKFEGEDGEHFFRATLIQTLFYGIFSSWVLWSRDHSHQSKSRFKWHETIWNIHVPMIGALFSQIATPNKLKPLGIDEVLDWSERVLNRVERRLWSANEIKLLKKLYPTENTQSIADKLGRPLQSVKSIAYLNGLKKVGTAPIWSRQEDTLLKKLYPHNSVRDIANQLGRTVPAVMGRAHKLGISKPQHIWSKKELNLLRKLYPSRTIQQIADHIGRPVPATRMRIHRLGLKKRK